MEKKYKRTILIILIIMLIIIIGFYALTIYKNESDNKEFKEVLKNANDIENVSDKAYYDMYKKGSIQIDDYIEFCKSDSANCSKEMDLLKEFREKTSNQTQKEYLNIEIKRLEKEKLERENSLDNGNQYKRYLNGEITANHYSKIRDDVNNKSKQMEDEEGEIKDEAITYINNHPELKVVLEEINIDEDFYTNERGGTGGSGRLYFKK